MHRCLFSPLKGWLEGGREWLGGYLSLNSFSMPAFFLAALVALALVFVNNVFSDVRKVRKRHKYDKAVEKESAVDIESGLSALSFSDEVVLGILTRFDLAILGCMLLNVATKGSIAVYETLGATFASSHFVGFDAETIVAVGFDDSLEFLPA